MLFDRCACRVGRTSRSVLSVSAIVPFYWPTRRLHNFLGLRLRKRISSTARSASSNDRIHIAQHCVRTCGGVRRNEDGGSLLAAAPLMPAVRRKREDRFLPGANSKLRGSYCREED